MEEILEHGIIDSITEYIRLDEDINDILLPQEIITFTPPPPPPKVQGPRMSLQYPRK